MRFFLFTAFIFTGCQVVTDPVWSVDVLDTDFSKGRLGHVQTITLNDLEKFHGHLCDGLVVGALAFQYGMAVLDQQSPIDRTNLRIISHPSPCLTDVAAYLSGGRYQYNSLVASSLQNGIFTIAQIDKPSAVQVFLKKGVKPTAIDSLGALATQKLLAPCDLDTLRALEDKFISKLLAGEVGDFFEHKVLTDFNWPEPNHEIFQKTDVLNKNLLPCTR